MSNGLNFALFVVLAQSGAAYAQSKVDTSIPASPSVQLNDPQQLVADSSNRLFPIYFCGEEVPVNEPRVARRWAQTLINYGNEPDFLLDLRERAAQFFPIIDPILRKYKIPRDFRFMPLAESALNNNSVSPKGAVGYWQIMPGTARDLGLKVNDDVDERRNLEKSTIAVCRHLHQLYRVFNSWTLVAAAYNGGINHVRRRMDQQGQTNYYRLRLHRETSHYLFQILAFKELLSNPRQYALLLRNSTIAELTKPLPSWHKPLALPKKIKDSPTVEILDDDSAQPTWGPRPNNTLMRTPSDSEQLIAQAASTAKSPFDTDADFDTPGPHVPVKKLMMGLMVLRFRRPRTLEWRKARWTGNRPLHFWDWL